MEEATAFGVGFGGIEAIFIGIPSLIQLTLFIVNPSIIESLPPPQGEVFESSLNSSTWIAAIPMIEKTFTLFTHVFATILIYLSAKQHRPRLLFSSILYKSMLDAFVSYIQTMINIQKPITFLEAEAWIITMGLIGLLGVVRFRKTYQDTR